MQLRQKGVPETMEESRDELLITLHKQFAENQNHHQRLLIQFISAVIAVMVGYAIVYANTTSQAKIFDMTREGPNILSYATIHLIGSYFIAEMVLTLLCALILHIGYAYRRDQNVNRKIREYYLERERLYERIFGDKSYDPRGKNIFSFLPSFNLIFATFIIFLHLLMFSSLFYAFSKIEQFSTYLVAHYLSGLVLGIVALFPIGVSLGIWSYFYCKYLRVVM